MRYPFKCFYDERVERFFVENRLFLKHPFGFDAVFKTGEPIRLAAPIVAERYATMPPRQFMDMGAYSYCMSTRLKTTTVVGRYCSIATNVRVMGINHPTNWFTTHTNAFRDYGQAFAKVEFGKDIEIPHFDDLDRPVIIEHDVWIGQDVLLKGGIRIGTGAVIAAGSVVSRDVESYAIVGGVPARRIRKRFSDEIIERLLALAWWRYNYADFGGLPSDDVSAFLDGLERRIAAGDIVPFEPGFVRIAEDLQAWLHP